MRVGLALFAMMALAACSGTSDLGRGKTGQKITVSGHSYHQVWDAAVEAVKTTRGDQSLEIEKTLTITKADKVLGVIEANSGMSMLSWGEVVAVFITPISSTSHEVEVESRAKLTTNIVANNWEDEVLASIKRILAKVKP